MDFFFSDAHLGLGDPRDAREREREVVRFLEHVGRSDAETLWIVGDLFDYWFEYRSVIPRAFVRTVGALAALADAGVQLEYLMGNHDFGHRDFFEQEMGARVHPGDVEREIHGHRVYIAHGDGKAFNDRGYLILKKILRARTSNRLWRFLHPDIGIGLAARASRRSRDHTNRKNYDGLEPGEIDGLATFARQKIEEEAFDLVVMGHSHSFLDLQIEEGRYINLGDWITPPRHYLTIAENITVEIFD